MKSSKLRLIGPFIQVLTMDGLRMRGPLADDQLEIIDHAGVLVNGGVIEAIGPFRELKSLATITEQLEGEYTLLPGFVDVHTHICWAGSRAQDYALRLSGKSYLEIARQGGGIWRTVTHTRETELDDLAATTVRHADKMLHQGTTTLEVKSGYGLNTHAELKILRAIQKAQADCMADLVPTCLAAHMRPKDFAGPDEEYLDRIIRELLPLVRSEKLSSRADIYVDDGAFGAADARRYLLKARDLGFDVVVHADQFTVGGARLAVEIGAMSADHLEVIRDEDINLMAGSTVIPVVLPGASIGLGTGFAPARKILDAGNQLVIASDWNPGSAPMGNLVLQAALLGVFERLTMAETLASLTCRASAALKLNDRGILKPGMLADFIAFPCSDYREILYYQGSMEPEVVWKRGRRV